MESQFLRQSGILFGAISAWLLTIAAFNRLKAETIDDELVAVAKLEFEANKARADAAYARVCEEAETEV